MFEEFDTVSVAQLDRFIKATDHPPAQKKFRAVAVVCSSLLNEELTDAPTSKPAEYDVVVFSVPNLYSAYNEAFAAAHETVKETNSNSSSETNS